MNKLGKAPLGDATYQYKNSRPYGFREEDFLRFYYEKLISPRAGPFWARGHNLNKLGKAPLGDAGYQISKLWALWFQRRRFLKSYYEKLISPRAGPFLARGHNLNKLGKAPLGDAACQISKLSALWFQRIKIFLRFSYISLCETD